MWVCWESTQQTQSHWNPHPPPSLERKTRKEKKKRTKKEKKNQCQWGFRSFKFLKFSLQGETYVSNHFLEQRRRIVTTTTSTSTNNKTTKVKRPKEDMFCVFMLFFCLSFVLWWVLFLMISSSWEIFLSPRI